MKSRTLRTLLSLGVIAALALVAWLLLRPAPAARTEAKSPEPAAAVAAATPAPVSLPVTETMASAPRAEVEATVRMYAAHAPLRVPEVADPDSTTNRQILQTMVTKALAHAPAEASAAQ